MAGQLLLAALSAGLLWLLVWDAVRWDRQGMADRFAEIFREEE